MTTPKLTRLAAVVAVREIECRRTASFFRYDCEYVISGALLTNSRALLVAHSAKWVAQDNSALEAARDRLAEYRLAQGGN
jgi:hypothetical protein